MQTITVGPFYWYERQPWTKEQARKAYLFDCMVSPWGEGVTVVENILPKAPLPALRHGELGPLLRLIRAAVSEATGRQVAAFNGDLIEEVKER